MHELERKQLMDRSRMIAPPRHVILEHGFQPVLAEVRPGEGGRIEEHAFDLGSEGVRLVMAECGERKSSARRSLSRNGERMVSCDRSTAKRLKWCHGTCLNAMNESRFPTASRAYVAAAPSMSGRTSLANTS